MEGDSGREREGATAKSTRSKWAWINVTTVNSHQRVGEWERERKLESMLPIQISIGNIMPQSYPLPAYYLPGLLEHCTSMKHFDSKSNHSVL